MFNSLVGNSRVTELLRGMLRSGNVPGALLFTGPEGVGKRLFALQLAKAAVCRDLRDGEACDRCSACLRVMSTNPPSIKDVHADKKLSRTDHVDVIFAQPIIRIIRVDMIRDLEREAQFTPLEGRARYFLINDAHLMQEEASNALLKTLEEPAPTTRIILITSRPAVLLPTIRSRSQLVRFTPIETGLIKDNLLEGGTASAENLDLLAGLSEGSIGRALAVDPDRYREQRELMLEVLTSASISPNRARLLRLAEELNDAKHKDEFEAHLDVLETLAIDVLRLAVDEQNASIVNDDLRRQLRPIAERARVTSASGWVQKIETLRAQLKVNVNRKVAADALFLSMMVPA